MALKYYYDLMSQPCRTLYIFMKQANIPFESHTIALRKGEQFSEEFVKLNPMKKVPVIVHNNLRLTESIAIARYLCREYSVPDHWYPKDSVQQAKVDEFLEWHHLNLRTYGSMVFIQKIVNPLLKQQPVNNERVDYFRKELDKVLDNMEKMFLTKTQFLNRDEISLADLFAVCEIEQPMMSGYDVLENKPRLQEWMKRVQLKVEKDYKDAHVYSDRLKKTMTQSNL